ncbi:MAG: hypothetical protein DCF15_17230 [Phormidesmis priestleyi]|uniref:Uncharacterized protein n=1 Tax=Phormidesmis priestleyi TaxID=268141 RepID=A0A2W4WVD6_9CYAN|nr:MAG: hypothetical protein DCF15_17230 [Phormidesmis priestleyi]
MYLSTEVAERERQANQSRVISLSTWALSIALVGLAISPVTRNNRPTKTALLLSAAALTASSQASATNLATHDRVLQDFRDISDNQRQQLIYEAMKPADILKPSEVIAAPPALLTHNISAEIAANLKSTVLLGAPRAGKGYALAKALELLPDNVDLWLIDPKDDPNESHYWPQVPVTQRVRFDVTTLNSEAVDDKVSGLFERFLLASSSAERPKLLVVDECSPGLSKGMTPKAYKAFMGRLATICSVGPSKGKFVWIMAQASTVEDLAMTSGNKASFRLAAVGHAQQTEKSWYSSLKRSMQVEPPADALTGYIQMLDSEWGYSQPFQLTPTDAHRANEPEFGPESQAVLEYFQQHHPDNPRTLRQLTQAGFARKIGLTSQPAMRAAIAPLASAELIAEDDGGNFLLAPS